MKRILAISCLLLGANAWSSAQQIEISLEKAPFQSLVDAVESQSSLRFYYSIIQTDSIRISLKGEFDIQTLLNKALAGTGLSAAVVNKNVFITKERTILTGLPAGIINQSTIAGSSDFDGSSFEAKNKKQSTTEVPVITIGSKSSGLSGSVTLSGSVRDAKTGESLPGVAVFLSEPLIGTSTDAFGQYSLTLPKGKRVLTFKSVGMKPEQRTIMLYENGKVNIELQEEVTALKDVLVNSDREATANIVQMGKEKLDIRTMRQMPLALGETDVLKVMLALPGVQSVGEGASGINVRGGATNQNLILFNGATIYNPSHLFGFFSTFNPDVVKNVELYKSGLEANQGGRLSSVLEVTAREGNLKRFNITGGISPITGRLTVEGPLFKEKTSFLMAGRSTYSDWILKQLQSSQFNKSRANFYDGNFMLSHKLNENNHLTASAYISQDRFKLNSDTLFQYSDRNMSLHWAHRFNQLLFGELTATTSEYRFGLSSSVNPVEAFQLNYSIKQFQVKSDFKYILSKAHTLHAGVSVIRYKLAPGDFLPLGTESIITPERQQVENGVEYATYVGDHVDVNEKFALYAGLRYSLYSLIGPRAVFQYQPGAPIELSSLVDTIEYKSGPIKTYHGLEPRITARLLLDKTSSLKFSYGRTRQYIQMLSNNTAVAPTDVWKLSDPYIKPQIADQISSGWFKNWRNGMFEFSAELYYKYLSQATDFQNGALLLRNKHIETDVLNAKGQAYGAEILIKKTAGRLNGWISYTYSRSFLKTQSKFSLEQVNSGKLYPSNFDKPHSINAITNYKFSRRINISFNATYSTGRPITVPLAKFNLDGSMRLEYSNRNASRIPDYFRTDLSINLEGNHKVKKFAHSSWTLAIYNVTARRNAYSVFFRSENGVVKGYKLSVFGIAIPTITYNFKI